jgi:hypothetical protein
MKCALILTALVLASCVVAPARAQEAVKGPCFELTPPVAQTERSLPFLINRCTGETWMLVRVPVRDSDFVTYEWQPLSVGKSAPIVTKPLGDR